MGYKDIVLVPPTQRLFLYTLTEEGMPPNYSPVDFFNPDLHKYPDFAKVKGKYTVRLNAGDILFIPSYWWHHIKSSQGQNMAVNLWYTMNYMTNLLLENIL